MKRYGCIGKTLTHSFSKEIHGMLADYEYELIELSEDEIPAFFAEKAFAAVNVTMPYKQTVVPYLDEISEIAQRIGAVNTIVNRDGKLCGYNTDYWGMRALIQRVGLNLSDEKVLILGSGGTAKTAAVVAADLGAAEILTVSRRKTGECITYAEAAAQYADAGIIINTTPVGMYPHCEAKPIDLSNFTALKGVIDAVYNPLRTDLVLAAKTMGVKAEGGLYMLVMQAIVAIEKFLDVTIPRDTADRIYAAILSQRENIVLMGMPGSGKSTVGRQLERDGYVLMDTDREIECRCGCTVKELFEEKGEAYFRHMESTVITDISVKSGCVIATGGGAILQEENVKRLKRNGKLFFLDVPLMELYETDDRPLSDTTEKLARLYAERIPVYRAVADVTIPRLGTARDVADDILQKRME